MKLQLVENPPPKVVEAAETANVEDLSIARQERISALIRKGVILAVVGCVAYAGFHFRGNIKESYDRTFPRTVTTEGSEIKGPTNIIQASAKTKETVRVIKADAEKRNAEVESFFK